MISPNNNYSAVFDLLLSNKLGEAIEFFEKNIAGTLNSASLSDRFSSLRNDYNLMLSFLMRGFEDSQRNVLYNKLIVDLDRITADALHNRLNSEQMFASSILTTSQNYDFQHDNVRQTLEDFVADSALLNFDAVGDSTPKADEINKHHFDYLNRLFNHIWLSSQWTADDAKFYQELLLSPTIDINDIKVLVSAVFLANTRVFDAYKTLTLVNISTLSPDSEVVQRALVGWVLSLDKRADLYPFVVEAIHNFTTIEANAEQIVELQKQVYFCLNAENDGNAIQKDIMPDLINNSNFRITRFGIEEKDSDSLQDILHPESDDEAVEKVEKSFQRMIDMQKNGADIYFGGFAQMKRFSFFYQTVNWFYPFTPNHPLLTGALSQFDNRAFLDTLLSKSPFCDSDKYSLVLAISQVINQLPPSVKEMMSTSAAFEFNTGGQDLSSPTYQRRIYLQDLYRFFRLYQNKSMLGDPFTRNSYSGSALFAASSVLASPALKDRLQQLGVFLYKRNKTADLEGLLSAIGETDSDSVNLIKAQLFINKKNFAEALHCYEKMLRLNPANIKAMNGKAKTLYLMKKYEEASAAYNEAMLLNPDNISVQLNYCASLSHTPQAGKALDILYRLYYDYPERTDIQRLLAWSLLCAGRIKQASDEYAKILSGNDVSADDCLNAAYPAWINRDMAKAVELLKRHIVLSGGIKDIRQHMQQQFTEDSNIFSNNNIAPLEQMLVIDLVCVEPMPF